MADRGRPIPIGAAIYASAHKAVQPPDDRTYSAEVTVFQRNLPHHRSARAESPYTRSYIIPPRLRIVKQNFRKNHKFRMKFSYNLRAASGRRQCVTNTGDHRYTIGPARYRSLVGYFLLINRMSLRTSDRCHWCGNPHPLSHSDDEHFQKKNGLPRRASPSSQ